MAIEIPIWDPQPCGLSVRADSLTVFLDLSRIPHQVATGLRQTLNIPDISNAAHLAQSDGVTTKRNAQEKFSVLYDINPACAFQYATILSAFFHESRHIHDLRATWIGIELLLSQFQVYAGSEVILSKLSEWLRSDNRLRINIPLSKSILEYRYDPTFPSYEIGKIIEQTQRVTKWWDVKSSFETIPGTSIREIFETLGFLTQIEWIADVFGRIIADEISKKIIGKQHGWLYFRPIYLLATRCEAKNIRFDPEPHDLMMLLFESLNINGLDEAFNSDGLATEFHPGAWLDRFITRYVSLDGNQKIPSEHRAISAIQYSLMDEKHDNLSSRIKLATERISNLQEKLFREMVHQTFNKQGNDEPLLLLTELGIDFRDMIRIIGIKSTYFTPSGYVDLLTRGDLLSVFVRVKTEVGMLDSFQTSSYIPGNHAGGISRASEHSQIIHMLISGRQGSDSFYADSIFRKLTEQEPNGYGLRFHLVNY